MDVKCRAAAIETCKNVLREDYQYNLEKKIWPSINKIIEGLLARTNELADVYEELYGALAEDPMALKSFSRCSTPPFIPGIPRRSKKLARPEMKSRT